MSGALRYFSEPWPDPVVPEGEPVRMLYEVDAERDVVLRIVDVFADGRLKRNSLALEERDGHSCISLVQVPFVPTLAERPLEEVARDAFDDLWSRATDKPWP